MPKLSRTFSSNLIAEDKNIKISKRYKSFENTFNIFSDSEQFQPQENIKKQKGYKTF